AKLTQPITEKEIKDAIFAMNPDKSPDPDGMSAAFYRQHWETIKPGTNAWDLAKLQSLITPEDIPRILSIRPSTTNGQDKIRWKFGSWGTYTVKTGYHIQRLIDMDEQQYQVVNSPQSQLRNNMLTKLWKINLPPKIKIFWWKILHNGLPVAENLIKRGCKINNLCQLCGEEIET
ncbi:unnamed protein product, partial [Brassica oleracea var. botrytis]